MGLPNPRIYVHESDRCEYVDWITSERCAYETQILVANGHGYCKWHGPELTQPLATAVRNLEKGGLL